MTNKRIIQIELNEISFPIIEQLIAKGKLPNFAKINTDWHYLKTTSEKDYDKLEPWIQWVTAHTGKTYQEHEIFRLGDAHKLEHKQVWEALSENGIESGIIGSMNITRGNTEKGIFFPDPWAIKNETYPDNLRPLWDLISSRVQAHATSSITTSDVLKGAKACLEYRLPINLYYKIANQMVQQKANKLNKWKLAAVFDEFLAEIFKSVLKRTDFGYYTLFLNAVAHYQHHYWRNFDRSAFDPNIVYDDIAQNHDPITYGYEVYDKILGQVIKAVGDDKNTTIIVASGLSQVPYNEKEEQGGMNYYRLNNHQKFASQIGLDEAFEIFPLMSRDWQVKYSNETDRLRALDILGNLSIKGEPLFNVKENTKGYIFVETSFTKGVENTTLIKDGKQNDVMPFLDVFTNIAIKSGHHTGIGNLWVSNKELIDAPQGKKIPLTSLYDITLEHLGIDREITA